MLHTPTTMKWYFNRFEVDMANAIGEKMGYDVQFVETEWDSITAALDAGNFDVVMNQVTITDERKEKFDFSTPYIYSKPVLIVAADNTDINSFEDINGKKLQKVLPQTSAILQEATAQRSSDRINLHLPWNVY